MDPISCVKCGQQVWCLYIKGEGWICKTDYLDMGYGTFSEWNRLNDEAKKRREEKRRGIQAEGGEYQDYSPRPQYHQKSKESKPQECKYKCKTMLIWDNSIPDKNKFKEVETGIRHTYDRCLEIKNTTEKK